MVLEKIPDIIVTQWTGLIDKIGVKVYEGDILKNMNRYFVVVWNAEGACFEMSNGYHLRKINLSYEVVGNIYENQNLIK